MVVRRGLAPRAWELVTNTSALLEVVLREQQRLGHGQCWAALSPVTLEGGRS